MTPIQKVLLGSGVTLSLIGVAYIIYFFATRSSARPATVSTITLPAPDLIVAAVQQPQNSRKVVAS